MDDSDMELYDSGEEEEEDEEVNSMDSDAQFDEDPATGNNCSDMDKYKFKLIHTDQIINNMNQEIEKARSVIQRSYTATRILLSAFKWDAQNCIDDYYSRHQSSMDSDDSGSCHSRTGSGGGGGGGAQRPPAKHARTRTPHNHRTSSRTARAQMYADVVGSPAVTAGSMMEVPESIVSLDSESEDEMMTARDDSGLGECRICFLDIEPGDLFQGRCGHGFCKDCVIKYLEMKIVELGKVDRVLCAEAECSSFIDDEQVLSVLRSAGKEHIVRKYKQLMASSYVQCNKLMRWCPGVECVYAFKVEQVLMAPVTCPCGKVVCFKCGEDWHEPITCHLLRQWKQKCNSDSENYHYIFINTKQCPKCKANIEKDGGCNHMTCKNSNCQHHFCWMCLGDWTSHGQNWFNCSRYQEEGARNHEQMENSRSKLKRFVHYSDRYNNHLNSLNKENELHSRIEQKTRDMQDQCSVSYIDVKFLPAAAKVLVDSRRTLMYTYAFAFYLEKNNQKEMFEDNQRDLEVAVENLSEQLERDIVDRPFSSQQELTKYQQSVQDLSSYCSKRINLLMDHVHEGYNKDWWLYIKDSGNILVSAGIS